MESLGTQGRIVTGLRALSKAGQLEDTAQMGTERAPCQFDHCRTIADCASMG